MSDFTLPEAVPGDPEAAQAYKLMSEAFVGGVQWALFLISQGDDPRKVPAQDHQDGFNAWLLAEIMGGNSDLVVQAVSVTNNMTGEESIISLDELADLSNVDLTPEDEK